MVNSVFQNQAEQAAELFTLFKTFSFKTINFNQSKIVPRKLFNYPERDPMFSLGTALQY